jgi:hypothetical protein
MAAHVGRAKQIIQHRGYEASQTALGRALFASYFRMDIAMSVMMGNPVFLDESWWTNDPLNRMTLTEETPVLIAADAALVTLTVIIAKLTHLKQSATARRRKLMAKIRNGEISGSIKQLETQLRLERQIRQQVESIESELNKWDRSLPSWFCVAMPETSGNDPLLEDPMPDYVHPFIPTVLSCADAARIQIWRIANPGEQVHPPQICAIVANMINMFLQVPGEADLMIIPNIWIAGLFLRSPVERDNLEREIRRRIEGTDYFLWNFCIHGLIHAWASSERKGKKPFISLPEGALEVVPGVSENLWRAEGVMNLIAGDIEAEEAGDRDHYQPLYRFTGDTTLYSEELDDSDWDS